MATERPQVDKQQHNGRTHKRWLCQQPKHTRQQGCGVGRRTGPRRIPGPSQQHPCEGETGQHVLALRGPGHAFNMDGVQGKSRCRHASRHATELQLHQRQGQQQCGAEVQGNVLDVDADGACAKQ